MVQRRRRRAARRLCVGLTVFVVALERQPRLAQRADRRACTGAAARAARASAWRATLEHFIEGLGLFRDLPRLAWVFLLSFVMFGVLRAVRSAISMWSLGIHVPWYGGLIMLVITAIGIMVPAAPGYIGTLNLACIAGLALFDVGKELAVPFSWFYWASQWLPITAGRALLPATARACRCARSAQARGERRVSGRAPGSARGSAATILRTAAHTSSTSRSVMRGNSGSVIARR